MSKFAYPRILHLFWNGKLPFLNYITILSFKKYHSNWMINLYTTSITNEIKGWKEIARKNVKKDYLKNAIRLKNVNLIDATDIIRQLGIEKENYVRQSDVLRIYFLSKYGGVYCDFDNIFIKNIEDVFCKFNKDILFRCKRVRSNMMFYPIGFFVAKKNSKIFNLILEHQLKQISKHTKSYSKYGADVFRIIFKGDLNVIKEKYNFEFVGREYYLPFEWNGTAPLYNKITEIENENTVAIHWFGGTKPSLNYSNKLDKNIFEEKCTMDLLIKEYLLYK